MCPIVAVCVIWRWILNDEYGPVNALLMHLGMKHPPAWLGSTTWAKPAIMMMLLWIAVGGYNCVLYLAGLQNIAQELYEAADLDGASSWRRFRHVTWPLLSPPTFFIFTMGLISGLQGGFTPAYLMTSGGPGGATTTLSYYIYNNAFVFSGTIGRAAAMAWILFVLIFGATLVNWRYHHRVVHYG
jgi:multiple sugar transport system permease protein